jgi:hypothetical protein
MSITIFSYLVNRESSLTSVTADEFQTIEEFKKRVEQLHETKSKNRTLPMSSMSFNEEGTVVAYENNLPDTEYILAIAVRFRLFFGNNERTNFEKVINIVRRRATDEWAKNYIDHIRSCYLHAMKSNETSTPLGASIDNRLMISLWFNSEFFHSDSEKREKLDDINKNIGERGSLFHLYIAIRRCSVEIDRLYTVLHKFGRDHALIYTPNHHFSREPA